MLGFKPPLSLLVFPFIFLFSIPFVAFVFTGDYLKFCAPFLAVLYLFQDSFGATTFILSSLKAGGTFTIFNLFSSNRIPLLCSVTEFSQTQIGDVWKSFSVSHSRSLSSCALGDPRGSFCDLIFISGALECLHLGCFLPEMACVCIHWVPGSDSACAEDLGSVWESSFSLRPHCCSHLRALASASSSRPFCAAHA